MTTIELVMPRLHAGQRRVLEHRQRFAVLDLGRRWGKTTLEVDLAVRAALAGQTVGWFAPNYQLLAEAWRELKRRLAPVTRHTSEVEHRLELVTGGVVECWSLDGPDPARGRKYARVVIDEAGIVRGLMERWQAAIRPTLTDLRGDAVFGGTPKGRNDFWALYQRGVVGEDDWSSHRGPSSENPHLDADEIAAARRDLPDRVFRQEYEAEFLEDGAGVFRRVAEASTLQTKERQDGHWYVIGADWGREHDYTALSVIDVTTREQVCLERFSHVEWALQYGRFAALCDRYKPAMILAEENSFGNPVVEHLQRQGLPVRPWTASNATKAAVVDGLALALERGVLGLLDDPVQTAELQAYTAERLPSGLLRYTAPSGGHDDTVIALCLAWEAATSTAPSRPAVDVRFALGDARARPPTDEERRRQLRGPGVNPFQKREG